MAKMDPWNFLEVIKELVTGGGYLKSGTLKEDAGFKVDVPFSLNDIIIPTVLTANTSTGAVTASGTVITTSETNLEVISTSASTSNTTIGTLTMVIPRDYDEASDEFDVKAYLAMGGTTDTTVTVTATAYKKTPGQNIATVGTFTGTAMGSTSALSLTNKDQLVLFDMKNKGLARDDALTIVFVAGAHGTDAVLAYGYEPGYRSTLVSYHESDGNPRDGKNGNFLR